MATPSMPIIVSPMATPSMPIILKSEVKCEELPLVTVHQQQQPPQFLKPIEEFSNLSFCIIEFRRRFHELQNQLDFIGSAIQQLEQQINLQSDAPMTTTIIIENQSTTADNEKEVKVGNSTSIPAPVPAPGKSLSSSSSLELVKLCERMNGRGLRKYLTSNLSNLQILRTEVPPALKCAPKPARLVLDCFGGFYSQGSGAFTKGSHMIPGRKASILVLEYFLLIINDGIVSEFDSDVKQEAEQVAVAWRKRLKAEGGIHKASEIDAKGLLLFIGCFGIPKVYGSLDILDLIRLSNAKQISDALKRSSVLVTRVSDILERMMNNVMNIEAVDVAFTFGIEDKFPPQKLLSSFLLDSNEALKRKTREANNSPILLKEANQKHLDTLKSAMKFLEDRKLDPKRLLPEWQFREIIYKLEKDIAELNRKIDDKAAQKRKADENELLNNFKNQEAKRLRFTGSPMISSPSFGLHEQRVPGHMDGNRLSQMNMLDGGFSCHINNPYVAGSIPYGSICYSAAHGVPSTGSFAGVYRETLVDKTLKIMEGNVSAYGSHGVGDTSVIDRTQGQSYFHQRASRLYMPSPSLEGFVGLPHPSPTGAANRNSNSNLYRFADAV